MRRFILIGIGIIVLAMAALTPFVPKSVVLGGGGCPKLEVPEDDTSGDPATWYHGAINAPAAWEEARNCEDVVVALMDGGADLNNPSLNGHLWTNEKELVGQAGVDDDKNGCIDDVHGCDFSSKETDGSVTDEDGHGTMVAGIVAAIAPNAKIMVIQIGDDDERLEQPFHYAVDNGARVINLSWGFTPDDEGACPTLSDWQEEVPALAAGLDYALGQGAAIVAAAGNEGNGCLAYPAADPRLITVGATKIANGQARAAFSSWGPGLDVAAPGEEIIAPSSNGSSACDVPVGHDVGDGTSLSAPQVAALAALLLADEPEAEAADITAAILDHAVEVRDGNSVGAIDMAAAFGKSTPPAYTTPPSINCTITINNNSTMDFDVYMDGQYLGTVEAYGRLRLPERAYGARIELHFEAWPMFDTCPWSSYELCLVTLDPFTVEACVGQPFEIKIEDTGRYVLPFGPGCY